MSDMMDAVPASVVCPSCKKRLRVPATGAAKKLRCPACNTIVEVPVATLEKPPDLVVHPVPRAPAPAARPAEPSNPFEFDDTPASDPADVNEIEPETESEESGLCALCGECEAEREFFLCTQHTEGYVTKWLNFPGRCCEECFGTVSGLQTAVGVLVYAMLGAIALAVGAAILYGNQKLPAYAIAIASIPLVAVIIANCVVWWRRGALIARRALGPTLKRARAAFHKQTGIRDVVFVPLATVRNDSLDLQN